MVCLFPLVFKAGVTTGVMSCDAGTQTRVFVDNQRGLDSARLF